MDLYYHGLSDIGNIRANNEDYLFAGKLKADEYLFIVADGMGGHQAGEVASRKAVSMFVLQLEKRKNSDTEENNNHILEELKRIVIDINETLIQESRRSFRKDGMGTTLSALYIRNDRGYIAHVGDSRIYQFSNSSPDSGNINSSDASGQFRQFMQLTEDHSFVGRLIKDGFITKKEARDHPKRNVLYQSIGIKKDIRVQCTGPIHIQYGQKYLLCSDGLHGIVPDNEIKGYMIGKSTVQIAEQLVERAKFKGGPDNISVIVISTEKDETLNITDTVEMNPAIKKKRKTKIWLFILLGLLVLLLALIIYFLTLSVDDNPPSTPVSPKPDIDQILDPTETVPGGSGSIDLIRDRL